MTQGEKQSREDKTRGENFPTAGIKIPSEAHTLMPKAEAAPVPSGEDGLGSGEQGSGELGSGELGSGLCLGELDSGEPDSRLHSGEPDSGELGSGPQSELGSGELGSEVPVPGSGSTLEP